jgi:integrase
VHRTTGTANKEDAVFIACEWYDEARFRQRLGLAPETKTFRAVAAATVADMRRDIAAGVGRSVFKAQGHRVLKPCRLGREKLKSNT